MTNFGAIEAYDSGNGSGTIAPEQGGQPLRFGRNDVQQRTGGLRRGQRLTELDPVRPFHYVRAHPV